jgi:hypothetical protein
MSASSHLRSTSSLAKSNKCNSISSPETTRDPTRPSTHHTGFLEVEQDSTAIQVGLPILPAAALHTSDSVKSYSLMEYCVERPVEIDGMIYLTLMPIFILQTTIVSHPDAVTAGSKEETRSSLIRLESRFPNCVSPLSVSSYT